MTREPLPPRRDGASVDLVQGLADGNSVRFTATYGFDAARQVREVFCLSQKSGTDLQSLLHQACIAISVGLQHGATMEELLHTLGEDNSALHPRSIIGTIVRAGAVLDAERTNADIVQLDVSRGEVEARRTGYLESTDSPGARSTLAEKAASPPGQSSDGDQQRRNDAASHVKDPARDALRASPSPREIEAAVATAIPLKDELEVAAAADGATADMLEIPEFLRRKPERQYVAT
jgi:hypothetical protein